MTWRGLAMSFPLQIWERRSGSELWDDAERVPASRAFGEDGALLWRLLLLLRLCGALNLWHRLRCFCLVQGSVADFLSGFQHLFYFNDLSLIPLLFPLRTSSRDTRLCVQISWRTTMTGWASWVVAYNQQSTSFVRINILVKCLFRCSQNTRSSCILRTTSPSDSLWR